MLTALLALTMTAAPIVQSPAPPVVTPPAEAEISAALVQAAHKNQRVLLVWGGEW